MKHCSVNAARPMQNRKALETSQKCSLIKKSRYGSRSTYEIYIGCHERWALIVSCNIKLILQRSRESFHNHVNSSALNQTENLAPSENLSVAELKSYLRFRKKHGIFITNWCFFSMCASLTLKYLSRLLSARSDCEEKTVLLHSNYEWVT